MSHTVHLAMSTSIVDEWADVTAHASKPGTAPAVLATTNGATTADIDVADPIFTLEGFDAQISRYYFPPQHAAMLCALALRAHYQSPSLFKDKHIVGWLEYVTKI